VSQTMAINKNIDVMKRKRERGKERKDAAAKLL
jgi:hypothetical protein